jgi:hypothetical protein
VACRYPSREILVVPELWSRFKTSVFLTCFSPPLLALYLRSYCSDGPVGIVLLRHGCTRGIRVRFPTQATNVSFRNFRIGCGAHPPPCPKGTMGLFYREGGVECRSDTDICLTDFYCNCCTCNSSFFNPLLFASCTNTFSKWCKITRHMKRSAQ